MQARGISRRVAREQWFDDAAVRGGPSHAAELVRTSGCPAKRRLMGLSCGDLKHGRGSRVPEYLCLVAFRGGARFLDRKREAGGTDIEDLVGTSS